MAWYPDWVVALDDCATSDDGLRYGRSIVTPDNARDIIRELARMSREIKALEATREP